MLLDLILMAGRVDFQVLSSKKMQLDLILRALESWGLEKVRPSQILSPFLSPTEMQLELILMALEE